jgi:dihydroorotase
LAYAGALGLPIVEHAEDATQTEGAEANDGYTSTVLGLRGWPVAAEFTAVSRAIALLADARADVLTARLHLTHVSTGVSLELIRQAKARGLPVTCDVTPHHLAMSDEWVAGARRWAWEAVDATGFARDPWADDALPAGPFNPSLRVNPPLRCAEDAMACLKALADGTADAVATDHAPHREVDKAVEFGAAANGISGLETALGVLLAAVDAGRLPLLRAIEALTTGPASVLAGRLRRASTGLVEGALADLVVFDRSEHWAVTAEALSSRGKNSPLIGMALPGPVLMTVAGGRLAYEAPDA